MGKTPVRRLLRHGDRSRGGAGTDREPQPAEKLHPDGAMAMLVPPTRLPALGSGDALAAAAVLGVSLGAHEGAAMWDALHGQSLWNVLSAAARTGGPASSRRPRSLRKTCTPLASSARWLTQTLTLTLT